MAGEPLNMRGPAPTRTNRGALLSIRSFLSHFVKSLCPFFSLHFGPAFKLSRLGGRGVKGSDRLLFDRLFCYRFNVCRSVRDLARISFFCGASVLCGCNSSPCPSTPRCSRTRDYYTPRSVHVIRGSVPFDFKK